MKLKNVNAPEGATHYLPDPKGEPQMYYRRATTRFSDGTTGRGLEYFSPDFQTWRGSDERDPEAFISGRLVRLLNPPATETTGIVLAERLVIHEARRCRRLYRPLLGHEQAHLASFLAGALEHPRAQKMLAEASRPYRRARLLVRNARLATLIFLKGSGFPTGPQRAGENQNKNP